MHGHQRAWKRPPSPGCQQHPDENQDIADACGAKIFRFSNHNFEVLLTKIEMNIWVPENSPLFLSPHSPALIC